MPPDNVFTRRVAASVRSKRSRSSSARASRLLLRHAMQAPDHHEVRVRGHQPVDRRLLVGDTDAAAHTAGVVHDVEAADGRGPGGRGGQRGEDPDRGRLARAVVPEEPEHGSGRDVEVEVPQGPEVAVAFAQVVGLYARLRPSAAAATTVRPVAPVCGTVRMVYLLFVHSTTTLAVHCTGGKRESPEAATGHRIRRRLRRLHP